MRLWNINAWMNKRYEVRFFKLKQKIDTFKMRAGEYWSQKTYKHFDMNDKAC